MRRQRCVYTCPSQNESAILDETDSSSMISGSLPYPEAAWSPFIDPEQEPPVPFCVFPYSYFQLSPQQYPIYSTDFSPPIPTTSLRSLESISPYSDQYSGLHDFAAIPPACSTPYGDSFSAEYSFDRSLPSENVKGIYNEGIPLNYELPAFPTVANYGAVTILLRHLIRVDISPSRSVYITNPPSSCVAAMDGTGNRSCTIHPNGRVLHDGPEIHMTTLNKKAKISKRGIVFTSTGHCLTYLVDASGTKTAAEKFRDIKHDFSMTVFYNYNVSQEHFDECHNMVNAAEYKSYWNGDEVWFIGGYRIKQDLRGDVKVTRNSGKLFIRSSPTTGQMVVKTLQTEFSIGRYPNNYFLVRKGDKQVSASVKGFYVQNGTQKAGFNKAGRVVLF